jgi:hypothetical protein
MSERPRPRARWGGRLWVSAAGLWLAASFVQAQQTTYIMPRVLPEQFVQQGAAAIRAWKKEALAVAGDRMQVYASVRQALRDHSTFQGRVAEIYPKEQLEWLLITDEVADSLTQALIPVLDRYQETHPEEVLTTGRQLLELELMKIVGPPTRMLGFHVILLADYAASAADSILARPGVDDAAGVADGVLRNIRDWGALYGQFHGDVVAMHESRLSQEDWIVARLKDNCGNSRWRVKQQYMALVGIDSTKTPPADRFAHELHLEADGCDDNRVVVIELPHFRGMQEVMMKRLREKNATGR